MTSETNTFQKQTLYISYDLTDVKCFKVVQPNMEAAVTWNEASDLCAQELGLNSSLAVVNDLLEHGRYQN